MKDQLKFICGVNDTEKIDAATKALVAYINEAEQQIMFLKKQADTIIERRNDLWKSLKETLAEEGKLPAELDTSEWVFEFSEDRTQLFRYKRSNNGIPAFIRQMMED